MPSQPNKKHICFLTPALVVGGVERVLVDTMPLLTPYFDVSIVSLHGVPESGIADSLRQAGAKLIAPNLPAKGIFLTVPYLSKFHYERILKDIDFDYLICVNGAAFNAAYTKKAKKTVFWNHTDNIEEYVSPSALSKKMKRGIFKLLYKKYDAIWTVCDKIKHDFDAAFHLETVHTLPNPVNYTQIVKKAQLPCDTLFDTTYTNVVTVGRFTEEKGFDRILNIWEKEVLPQNLRARLYLIGEPDQEALNRLHSNASLKNCVFLLGKKENPFPYLKQADLFVCPSRRESFGLVILEAMLLDIPVITTATAGGKYTTKDGTLAVCVDNNDDALAEAIMQFLSAPDKYPYSLEDAHNWAMSFDVPAFQDRIISLLSQLSYSVES